MSGRETEVAQRTYTGKIISVLLPSPLRQTFHLCKYYTLYSKICILSH
jgi:hypothetical protein